MMIVGFKHRLHLWVPTHSYNIQQHTIIESDLFGQWGSQPRNSSNSPKGCPSGSKAANTVAP